MPLNNTDITFSQIMYVRYHKELRSINEYAIYIDRELT